MDRHFFIGVDGGATKCIVRVEDDQGQILGRQMSGSANIRMSAEGAWESIQGALHPILNATGLSLDQASCYFHIGIGIAGCESTPAYQAFMALVQPHFASTFVISDAYTACVGAHQGQDGALIIAGTGSVGLQIEKGQVVKVGGYGFPSDDGGSGAWIGLQATAITLKYLDHRLDKKFLPAKLFAETLCNFISANPDHFIEWTQTANSTAFASLVPIVIQLAEKANPLAIDIMKKAAAEINQIAFALYQKQKNHEKALPCTISGGVSNYLQPYLEDALKVRLVAPKAPPEVGAIHWLHAQMKQKVG